MRSIFVSVRQVKLAKWQNDFLNEAMRWISVVMIVLNFRGQGPPPLSTPMDQYLHLLGGWRKQSCDKRIVI